MKGIEKSDYNFEDFSPIKIFPDLIPVVGLITNSERERRIRRLSIRNFYFSDLGDIKSWATLGTDGWPEPANRRASARGTLLAIRNAAFAAYHAFSPLILCELVARAQQIKDSLQ